ncbi:MAG: hypothetical protein ISP01_05385 [Methanobrevibacter arboriphilus]|uniref:Uncharacterized protein n=1 Tax=Methanobrevibacter arboriphilus TaxID=39441 RepID=A0A843AGD1_METAZ|nr:hypothetical protein [Methanobrevibacter arboriphilus]MBF4468821.1 hypothetical protein [Methanobrevibacter arboriphilus]
MKQVINDLFKHSDIVDENIGIINKNEQELYEQFQKYFDEDIKLHSAYDKLFIELENENDIIISPKLIKFIETLELEYHIYHSSSIKNELVTKSNGFFSPPTNDIEPKSINKVTIVIRRDEEA